MRVGVIQSCYVPWRGYFDFIASVDLFVIYDDVQFSKGSWRNRNRLKMPTGLQWLTIPVDAGAKSSIDEVRIVDQGKSWRNRHRELLTESLRRSPFFGEMMQLWLEGVECDLSTLSRLNIALIQSVCSYLQINTPIVNSRDYHLSGKATGRLMELLLKLGAKSYLSGPSARDYLDEDLFRKHGIRLEYKSYGYRPYPQQWGEFVDGVTILDLIANCGPASVEFLRSNAPNVLAIP